MGSLPEGDRQTALEALSLKDQKQLTPLEKRPKAWNQLALTVAEVSPESLK